MSLLAVSVKEERKTFDAIVKRNFKPKEKVSILRIVVETQLALLALFGLTSLTTYLWQLIFCPGC